MARMHGGRRPNEKAKDFKGTMKKLIRYMAIYKVQVFFVEMCIRDRQYMRGIQLVMMKTIMDICIYFLYL